MDPEDTLPPDPLASTLPAPPPPFDTPATLIPRHVSWDLSAEELDECDSEGQ